MHPQITDPDNATATPPARRSTEDILQHFLPKRIVSAVMDQLAHMPTGDAPADESEREPGCVASADVPAAAPAPRAWTAYAVEPAQGSLPSPRSQPHWSLEPLMERRFRSAAARWATIVDAIHCLLVAMMTAAQAPVLLAGGAVHVGDVAGLGLSVIAACTGPALGWALKGSVLQTRPVLVAVTRIALTTFAVAAGLSGWRGTPGAACGTMCFAASNALLLLSWALLRPLGFVQHVVTQMLQLVVVGAGVVTISLRYASGMELFWGLMLLYAVGFLLPSLLLFGMEDDARRRFLVRAKPDGEAWRLPPSKGKAA